MLPPTSCNLWIMAHIQVNMSRLVAENQLDELSVKIHSLETPYGRFHTLITTYKSVGNDNSVFLFKENDLKSLC